MEHEPFQFDEPLLRSAVLRVWGGEAAPQRLHGRITRLMTTAGSMDAADEAAAADVSGWWARWQSEVYRFVAAAVLLLSVALLVLYYRGALDGIGMSSARGPAMEAAFLPPSRTEVPLTLARSMVATHRACGKLHEHRFVGGVETYAELNVKLTASLGFPALARNIGQDWTFRGAGECHVGELRGAHLIFARGDQTISVFALPASCMSGVAPGAQYEGLVDGAPVAGFARSGAVYGVVGTSAGQSLSGEAIRSIRDTLFAEFDISCAEDLPELEELY